MDKSQRDLLELLRKGQTPRGVYFIRSVANESLIKIGYSSNVIIRFMHLHSSSPLTLELIGWVEGDRLTEREWHKRFKHLRSHGEWFHATPELIESIHKESGVHGGTPAEFFSAIRLLVSKLKGDVK